MAIEVACTRALLTRRGLCRDDLQDNAGGQVVDRSGQSLDPIRDEADRYLYRRLISAANRKKDTVMITHTLTTEAFQALGAPNLVYVRPISAADVVASGVPASALADYDLAPEQILYALHSADGARLAVLADRSSAYAAALAHELAPVSVH